MKRGTRRSISQVARRPNVYTQGGKALWDFDTRKKRASSRRMADGPSHTHTQTQGSHTHTQGTHTQSIVFYLFYVEEGGERRKKWERSWESICSLKRNLYLDVGKNVGYTDGG